VSVSLPRFFSVLTGDNAFLSLSLPSNRGSLFLSPRLFQGGESVGPLLLFFLFFPLVERWN